MLCAFAADSRRRVRQGAAARATANRPSRCRARARSCRRTGPPRFAPRCSSRAVRPFRTAQRSCSRRISEHCRPSEARTQNGVATVQFLGNGQSGKATIKALSGGSASDALELSVGAGAAGRVSVTANPASVPAAGGTTTISAAVVDASGNPLSGVPVTFCDDCRHVQLRRCEQRCSRNRAHDVDDESGCERDGHSRRHDFCAGRSLSAVSVRPTVSISVSATPTEGGRDDILTDGDATRHRGLTDSGGDGGLRRRIVRRSRIDLGDDFHSTRVWGQRFVPAYRHRGGFGRNLRDGVDGHRRAAIARQHYRSKATIANDDASVLHGERQSDRAAIASYTWTFGDGARRRRRAPPTTTHDYPNARPRLHRESDRADVHRTHVHRYHYRHDSVACAVASVEA